MLMALLGKLWAKIDLVLNIKDISCASPTRYFLRYAPEIGLDSHTRWHVFLLVLHKAASIVFPIVLCLLMEIMKFEFIIDKTNCVMGSAEDEITTAQLNSQKYARCEWKCIAR